MRAMILAAGRGERMRPLTDTCPKPLLPVAGRPLIVHHIEKLARAGFQDIVINTAWLGNMIEKELGDGAHWGVRLHYSHEAQALETAGGIAHALHLLGDAPFLLLNGDVHTDWDVARAPAVAGTLDAQQADMWLLLVPNPAHHPNGDFSIDADARLRDGGPQALTYAGVAIYHPRLFAEVNPDQAAPMAPLFRRTIAAGRAIGTRHDGRWTDVGTVDRLAELDASLARIDNVKNSML